MSFSTALIGEKMAVIEINASNFEDEVINSDKPVLLDFWAIWCGPCRSLSPVVEEIAQEHPEIKVGKVNTDEQRQLAMNFGVTSIPLLVYFENGKVVKSSVGARPKEAVEAWLFG